jgi:hypothetical protein
MAIEIISTLKPKNNGSFPIAEAKDITVDENGTRLDAKLTELANSTGGGSGGGGGLSIKSITFADRPTAHAWLSENFQKLLKATLTSNQTPYPLNFTNYYATSSNGESSFQFASIMPEPYLYENRVVQSSTFFRLGSNKSLVAMNGVSIEFYNDKQPEITESTVTEIPDAYWSALSAQFTFYYID